jgi:hypothetical protein
VCKTPRKTDAKASAKPLRSQEKICAVPLAIGKRLRDF